MIGKWNSLLITILLTTLVSCGDDEPVLPPIEQRVEEAISNLRSELVAPANGWQINYQPTNDAGVFLILMDFDEDGNVNIQSDVPDNDGEFLNQDITYRIDNSLGLELILETFAVFHYLFEQENAQFGAEFEFLYQGREGDNLIFTSKTDLDIETVLVFEPASASASNSFSSDLAANLNMFSGLGPQVFETLPTTQRLSLNDANVSVFWSLDLAKRNMTVEFAAVGITEEEIIDSPITFINHATSYSLSDGRLILSEPTEFIANNFRFTLSEIAFGDFENSGPSICPSGENNNPIFEAGSSTLGSITIENTAFSSSGIGFTEDVYSINATFIFDSEQNSLSEDDGLIIQEFPDISGFVFLYGVEVNDPEIPIYSAGVILEEGEIYLREFVPTTTGINRVTVEFTDDYFFRTVPEDAPVPDGVEQSLETVTNFLFDGSEMYAYEFPVDGFELFRLFNPCNSVEIFLVK